jgi:hypothetical protein
MAHHIIIPPVPVCIYIYIYIYILDKIPYIVPQCNSVRGTMCHTIYIYIHIYMTISFIYCAHTIHTSNAHATHNMYTACLYFTPIPIGNIHTCVYIYIYIYIHIYIYIYKYCLCDRHIVCPTHTSHIMCIYIYTCYMWAALHIVFSMLIHIL